MSEASGSGGRAAVEQSADEGGRRTSTSTNEEAEAANGVGAKNEPRPDARTGTGTGTGTGARVFAEGLGLRGPRGEVFTGITLDAPPGSLIAVEGPSGSGRTCLLLALTGRMKATSGHACVGGHPLPEQLSAVRGISALGPVPGVTDLEPSLSVAEQLRERVLLQRRFGGSLRALLRPREERAAASRARIDAALTAAGLDLDALPKGPRTRVSDLERIEALRLSLALALLGAPELVAVDDMDLKLSDAERAQAWSLLRSIADAGTTVLAVCSQAPDDALVVRTGGAGRTDDASRTDGSDELADGGGRTASESLTEEKTEREGQDALA